MSSAQRTINLGTMEERGVSVEKLLGDANWDNWKFVLKLTLREKDLWDVVENGVNDPELGTTTGSPLKKVKDEKSREKKDLSAQRVIGCAVSRDVSTHIMKCVSAKDMWDTLVDTYEMQHEMGMLTLNEKFLSAKKSPDEQMIAYITRMEEYARKLKDMNSPIADGTFTSNLLRGLPKEYRHFTTCWESAPIAERTLKNLKIRLRVEEDRLKLKVQQVR